MTQYWFGSFLSMIFLFTQNSLFLPLPCPEKVTQSFTNLRHNRLSSLKSGSNVKTKRKWHTAILAAIMMKPGSRFVSRIRAKKATGKFRNSFGISAIDSFSFRISILIWPLWTAAQPRSRLNVVSKRPTRLLGCSALVLALIWPLWLVMTPTQMFSDSVSRWDFESSLWTKFF